MNLFSYLLGYSRRQYLRFVLAQDFETTVREHIRAFEHLGGAAATCLYDNMKVVVRGYEDGEPVYNPRFLAFATHYGFRPWACRPRRPQTKGKIERPFRFVETSLLNGRTFRNPDHLNDVTVRWLADVADVRVHRTTQRRPVDLHAGGTTPPALAAGAALRRVRSGLPHGQRRGICGLPAEPLLGALGAHRAGAGRADHGRRTDRLRPAHRRDRPACPAAAYDDRAAE